MDLPNPIQEHVETIAHHKQEFLAGRSFAEIVADRIASFAGTLSFVALHLVVFTLWMLNCFAPSYLRFDPFQFPLLDTIVAWEAILLASFILTRQTSLARRSDEREHLMLQILLLAETEISALVRMTQHLAERNGLDELAKDPQIEELAQPTPIDQVAQSIQEKLSPNV